MDPHELVNARVDELFKHILAASTMPTKVITPISRNGLLGLIYAHEQHGFAEASYCALTTLAFVAPEPVVPRALEQLKVDIDESVLNSKKPDDAQITKGKDAKMAKWEANVRKSLASKKAVAPARYSSKTRPRWRAA